MQESEKEMLYRCVRKKATGYEAVETQDEYSLVEGELTLTKRKVTTKDVPPDLTAVKFLLAEEDEPVDIEALERERAALLREYAALVRREEAGEPAE